MNTAYFAVKKEEEKEEIDGKGEDEETRSIKKKDRHSRTKGGTGC